jgi:FtsP/CotA-like multicopper oxidase with cupredoxin domain
MRRDGPNSGKDLTAIHWDGVLLGAEMDGVPGISFPGIAPGETFTYRFTMHRSGTYLRSDTVVVGRVARGSDRA